MGYSSDSADDNMGGPQLLCGPSLICSVTFLTPSSKGMSTLKVGTSSLEFHMFFPSESILLLDEASPALIRTGYLAILARKGGKLLQFTEGGGWLIHPFISGEAF